MDNADKTTSDEFLNLLFPNQKRILAYVLYYIPNRTDADDVFQNIVSVLWKKFDQYQPGTDFIAWSIVIARYEIMQFFKKCKRDNKIHFDETLHEIFESDSKSVNDQFDERVEALRNCIKKLVFTDAQILKMRYEEDLTFAQIADRLALSSTAAFKKVSKIHSRLIQCIRQRITIGVKS